MSKKTTRREFLELSLKSAAAIPLISSGLIACQPQNKGNSNNKKLKILILGGTSFLGPHQIAYALERGHSVTTFTRGKTKPTIYQHLFENVEQLVGDRNDNLTALETGEWDVVIDNSGREAKWTRDTANLLKDRCSRYLYTSSTGVYYPYVNSDFTEKDEVLLELPEQMGEFEKLEYEYGVMKATSEQEAIKAFGEDRTIVVRPTYMFGPADRTDRFVYWPVRLSKGGETLVPGKKEDHVQYMDVRDVAEWMIRLIEENQVGTFNAVGPKEVQTMPQFAEAAQKVFDVESSFVQIDDYQFLEENEIYYIVPWIIPTDKNEGTAKINNQKALANGLTFRPLKQSIQDTYDWWYSDAVSEERRAKLESDPKSILVREKEILQKWKAR